MADKKVSIRQGDIYSFHPVAGKTIEEWVDESEVELDILPHDSAKPAGRPIRVVGMTTAKHEYLLREALKEKDAEIGRLSKEIAHLKNIVACSGLRFEESEGEVNDDGCD